MRIPTPTSFLIYLFSYIFHLYEKLCCHIYEGMKVGNVYTSAAYANYLRKRYRLKEGEINGRNKSERSSESKEQRYATTGDEVV